MAIEEIFVGTVDSLTAGCTIVSLEMEINSYLFIDIEIIQIQ
jgi:hypothetical protein